MDDAVKVAHDHTYAVLYESLPQTSTARQSEDSAPCTPYLTLHAPTPSLSSILTPGDSLSMPQLSSVRLPRAQYRCQSCFRPVKGPMKLGPPGRDCQLAPILTEAEIKEARDVIREKRKESARKGMATPENMEANRKRMAAPENMEADRKRKATPENV